MLWNMNQLTATSCGYSSVKNKKRKQIELTPLTPE
jgi:hypothetical protein